LLKALIRSGKKQLQDTSFEILSSLQDIGIEPGIQVYNQFLEYFGRTMDFRQMKAVLSIMNNSKPRIKPDVISYGYMINGFADAKKPRSALKLFSDMCNRGIPPNVQTYMGVLKAFARLRDGVSSVQVLSEMREKGIEPDLRCYATAMFTCVVGNQCSLAEAIFANSLKLRVKPDTVIYSLLLRALLQQGKWTEGEDLFRRMKNGLTVHGFRSTFRDWVSEETEHSPEVAEMALAHAIGNKVEAAYRRGKLLERRRRLMTDWESYCLTGVCGNVIHLKLNAA
jgi:pentatricopeptide repeat protein